MSNVSHWSKRHLDRYGDYDAVVVGDKTWSTATLFRDSARLASALIALGVRPGDRVVLALGSGREALISSTAVWMCGGVVVFVDPASSAEVTRVVGHAEPAAIIATHDAASYRVSIKLQAKELDALIAEHAPLASPVPRAPTDPAQLSYSSGSTGRPKAAIFTHGGMNAFLAEESARVRELGDREIAVLVQFPPTAFGGFLLRRLWTARAKLVIMDRFAAIEASSLLVRHGITHLSLVPTMAEALLALPDEGPWAVREIIIGGSHTSRDLAAALERRFGVRPFNTYGMTEAGALIASDESGARAGTVGRVARGVTLRILDANEREVPRGQEGEIYVKTPWSAAGYWGDPPPERVFCDDGWIRTGDRGRLDDDGFLSLVGRSKSIIIQGGYNVEPSEVADVVRGLPGVADVAVIGVPDQVLGEMVVACVVRQAGASVVDTDVFARCRAQLDPRKLPGRVHFVDALPRTATGKVKLEELRQSITSTAPTSETDLARQLRATPVAQRTGMLRDLIARATETVIGGTVEDTSVPFAQLGVTSLGAVQLVDSLGRLLGTRVPVTATFRHPSIDVLARALAGELFEVQAAAPVVEREASQVPGIAIVGIGCRLPASTSPDQFWDLLTSKRSSLRPPPAERWSQPRDGCEAHYVDDAESFDARFFEASSDGRNLDPQQRVFLEVAWEALEDAGLDALALGGQRVGTFLGIYYTGYPSPSPYGILPSMGPARLHQLLNLRGPSVAVDATCASALVAVHQAMHSLNSRETSVALVGGVNLITKLDSFATLRTMGVLSDQGACRPFDAAAHGLSRGEGCVVLVLKRLGDALRDGDQIHAVLRGSAINHDGRTSSLTAPNPAAQHEVITEAHRAAGVTPDDVQYVEAHGTGTLLGDPIEIEGLAGVFANKQRPLVIGSVKSNIGHLEAAAGVASILKVVLAMKHRRLPASLQFETPNPHVPWSEVPVKVQAEAGPWPDPTAPMIAGVSSFGMSGTNAHVIIEAAHAVSGEPYRASDELAAAAAPLLLPIAAKSQQALAAQIDRYIAYLSNPTTSQVTYRDIAYTASCHRAHLSHRVAVAGRSREDWIAELGKARASAGRPGPARQRLAFVFNGQGTQWWAMGRELFASNEVYRRTILECAERIDAHTSWKLVEELHRDEATSRVGDTEIAQPALFACQLGIARALEAWGVRPEVVTGHSLGEVTAAHVAGILDLDTACRLVVERGRAMQKATGTGRMASVEMSVEDAEAFVADFPGVEVGASNGPKATVLSGPAEAIERAIAMLKARRFEVNPLQVNYAFHSKRVEAYGEEVTRAMNGMAVRAPTVPLVSTVTGEEATALDEHYWGRQLRERVRFLEATRTLYGLGCTRVVEIGPHPALIPGLRGTATAMGKTVLCVPTLRRKEAEPEAILRSIAALYGDGFEIDWKARYPERGRLVALPTYAWQHERYWLEAAAASPVSVAGGDAACAWQPGAGPAPAAAGSTEFLRELHARPAEQRVAFLEDHLLRVISTVVDIEPAKLERDVSLESFGVDSFRLVGLRMDIERDLDVEVSSFSTVATITADVLAAFEKQAPAEETQAPVTVKKTGATSGVATIAQQAFWDFAQTFPDDDPSGVHHFLVMAIEAQVKGRIDVGVLRRAMQAFAHRYEVLRSSFREIDGRLHQFVLAPADAPEIPVEELDVTGATPEETTATTDQAIEAFWNRKFPVATGPNLRVLVVRSGTDVTRLVFAYHHVLWDTGFMSIMANEISTLYTAILRGDEANALPPVAIQSVDVTEFLTRFDQSPAGRAQATFWREHLADASPVELPIDFPREPVTKLRDEARLPSFPVHLQFRVVPAETRAKLAEMCRSVQVTPFVAFLAGFAAFLKGRKAQPTVCVQSSYNLRVIPGLDKVASVLGNFLIYRIDVGAPGSFRDLLTRTKASLAAEQDNYMHSPYAWAPHYLRRINFNYMPFGTSPITTSFAEGSANWGLCKGRVPRIPFDLQIQVLDGTPANGTPIALMCSKQLFTEETCASLANGYIGFLEELIANPERAI